RWIAELALYDYKARMYAPALGRFLQTDPIGYSSGPNIYAYVRGDPVNLKDPLGLGYDPNAVQLPKADPPPDNGFTVWGTCGMFCTSTSDPSAISNILA